MSGDTKDAALHHEMKAEQEIDEAIPSIESDSKEAQEPSGAARDDSATISETALAPYEQMAREWSLPPKQQMLLVHPPQGIGIAPWMVEMVVDASKRYGIPLSGFNLIPRGKKGGYNLYINADGLRFRLFTDPRGIQSKNTELEHMPDFSKDQDYVAVKCTITMENGNVATGWGISEWPPEDRNARLALGDLTMKMETKAERRATIKLVGSSLPVHDDDWFNWTIARGDAIDAESRELPPKKTEPTSSPELLSMANELDESLDIESLPEILGIEDIFSLDSDGIKEAWKVIKEKYGEEDADREKD